jgi:hypothetical protein
LPKYQKFACFCPKQFIQIVNNKIVIIFMFVSFVIDCKGFFRLNISGLFSTKLSEKS